MGRFSKKDWESLRMLEVARSICWRAIVGVFWCCSLTWNSTQTTHLCNVNLLPMQYLLFQRWQLKILRLVNFTYCPATVEMLHFGMELSQNIWHHCSPADNPNVVLSRNWVHADKQPDFISSIFITLTILLLKKLISSICVFDMLQRRHT